MGNNSGWPKSNAGRPDTKAGLLGQVTTPKQIAEQMVNVLFSSRTLDPVSILDPCVGPGTFLSSMNEASQKNSNDIIVAIEIDKKMVNDALNLQRNMGKDWYLINSDYLQLPLDSTFDYIIMNPPYVRHEWIDANKEYINIFLNRHNIKIPGTSNLYVYFIIKSIIDLKPGGQCVCIVYDSWQSTKYGRWLFNVIKEKCSYLEVIPIKEQIFKGVLINATIMNIIKKRYDEENIKVIESRPEIIETYINSKDFSTIDDLFYTKRGLQLKQSKFFMCDISEVKKLGATPFVKKSNLIKGYYVPDDHKEAALIVLKDNIDQKTLDELNRRIKIARKNPKKNESILNWYKQYPDKWYIHRKPSFAKIIFNYYLRNRPRHIYDPIYAYSDNFYGLIPKNATDEYALLAILNSTYTVISIMAKSRNQGDGLSKIQLFEYREVLVPDWNRFDMSIINKLSNLGKQLTLHDTTNSTDIITEIDEVLSSVLHESIPSVEDLPYIYDKIYQIANQPRAY